MAEKLMLLDGMSLAFRAFYALPPLSNKKGVPTGAILGFLNTLILQTEEERPDYLAVAFDLPEPTFRHKIFAEYKGTREAMPHELREQIPLIKDMLAAMNVPVLQVPGFEADDILGTLSAKAEDKGINTVIISGDRDLLQVVSDKVYLKIPRTRAGKTEVSVFNAADVREQIGVSPAEFVDVKALMGDSSDNIPGVPSIGEKTAIKLIQKYGSLDAVLENAADVTPKKAAENLVIYREQAILSRQMAQIDTNVPVELDADALRERDFFNGDSFALVKELELKSLYGRFKGKEEIPRSAQDGRGDSQAQYDGAEELLSVTNISVQDENEVRKAIEAFSAAERVAYSIDYDKTFQGVSFAAAGVGAVQIQTPFGDIDEERVLRLATPFFESSARKIAWDAKTHLHLTQNYGIILENIEFDAMLAAHLLGENVDAPENAAELLALAEQQKNDLRDSGMERLFYDIEMPLVRVLYDMEKIGVLVDLDELKKYNDLLEGRINDLTEEIYIHAGEKFNINSTQQMSALLFGRLGLVPEGKPMKTGAYSTSAETLERLASAHPVIPLILSYRQLSKLKSTYADGLSQAVNKATNRIHTTFNQCATATGRLSSANPNLQNIPVRTALGRELRKVFIPREGCVLIDADYSQIELRVLAHMSKDPTMIEAFVNNADVHKITAAEVFGVGVDDVTPEQRAAAKTVNFGIIYGQSAFGLANELGITAKQADKYISGYFRRYPMIKAFMEETVTRAKSTGRTTTIAGRTRYFHELKAQKHSVRAFGERAAMNMPIQGSAADIIKIAMVRVHKRLLDEGLASRLILQVHDELLVETLTEEKDRVRRIVVEEMEGAFDLLVPLIADVSVGKNWFEAK